MYSRQHKTAKISPNSSNTPASNQFAPRRFVAQQQAEEVTPQQQTPNLQPPVGFSFANISILPPGGRPSPQPMQMKLNIGQPGDKYEQEADRVAKDVVQQINSPQSQNIQRQEKPEDEELQMKPLSDTIQRLQVPEEDDELQMKPIVQCMSVAGEMAATPNLETSIQQARGGGQTLANSLRQPMEQAFGADFSRVKVHNDAQSHRLNQSIQAKAFTTGQDIFFRQGVYNPGSREGQELIAHELSHVVQQNGGTVQRTVTQVKPTIKGRGISVSNNTALERQVDVMPAKALQMSRPDSLSSKLVQQTATTVQPERKATPASEVPYGVQKVSLNFLSHLRTPLIQRRDTLTQVKMDNAKKIYKNYLKGDPPFKPQYGNFGKVSWFKGTGDPYIGGQAQTYDVTIDVRMPEPTRLHNSWFTDVLNQWDPKKEKRYDTDQHGEFWKKLGGTLDGKGLAEVHIPQGTLSRQGSGTFITADSNARPLVSLRNPQQLKTDIGNSDTADIENEVNQQGADQGAATKAPSFTVTLDRVDANVAKETFTRKLSAALVSQPSQILVTSRTGNPQSAAERFQKKSSVTVTATLTFQDYLTARKNAKQLATDGGQKLNEYGNLTLSKGANWKDTATRSYTERY